MTQTNRKLRLLAFFVLFFSAAYLLTANSSYASQDPMCSSPSDRTIQALCKISEQYDIPVVKVGSVQFAASLEATAKHCSFTLSANFDILRRSLMQDKDMWRLYPVMKQAVMASPPPNLRSFCSSAYKMMGPGAGEKQQIFK
jgi:hypothetical protein